jgi:hypothetical protein
MFDGGPIWRTILGKKIIVVPCEKVSGDAPLFEVIEAPGGHGGTACTAERRQQQAGQDGDDGRHHQQFH